MYVGGNSVKTIGNVLIDTGMIKESGINQELWRVKDWADDLLVLKLCSREYSRTHSLSKKSSR